MRIVRGVVRRVCATKKNFWGPRISVLMLNLTIIKAQVENFVLWFKSTVTKPNKTAKDSRSLVLQTKMYSRNDKNRKNPSFPNS
jgi:hypothetical protein